MKTSSCDKGCKQTEASEVLLPWRAQGNAAGQKLQPLLAGFLGVWSIMNY
jgi:hypothetical protein